LEIEATTPRGLKVETRIRKEAPKGLEPAVSEEEPILLEGELVKWGEGSHFQLGLFHQSLEEGACN
jgi:hypothetical protein